MSRRWYSRACPRPSRLGPLDPVLHKNEVARGFLHVFTAFLNLWQTHDFGMRAWTSAEARAGEGIGSIYLMVLTRTGKPCRLRRLHAVRSVEALSHGRSRGSRFSDIHRAASRTPRGWRQSRIRCPSEMDRRRRGEQTDRCLFRTGRHRLVQCEDSDALGSLLSSVDGARYPASKQEIVHDGHGGLIFGRWTRIDPQGSETRPVALYRLAH